MGSWEIPDGLRSSCADCAALCCVVLPLTRGADFAIDKPAGVPCPNLDDDFRCTRHDRLRADGFAGCSTFECFGAGQRATARGGPDRSTTFGLLRRVHELLYLVAEAAALDADAAWETHRRDLESAATADAADPTAEIDAIRRRVGDDLALLSARERTRRGESGPSHRGADLTGARRARADLRRADLRGALLLGADLRDADLRDADLLGADLRGARLAGADLRGALFLTPPQVAAASGDRGTRLPAHLAPPSHWTAAP